MSDAKLSAFVVFDEDSMPQFCAPVASMCHDHINDAIAGDIDGAAKWVVRHLGQFEMQPRGYLLQWPAPGGGRVAIWSASDASAKAIGCPVEALYAADSIEAATGIYNERLGGRNYEPAAALSDRRSSATSGAGEDQDA